MTTYQKRQRKKLTKTALRTLLRDLNGGSPYSETKSGYSICLGDGETVEVLSYVKDHNTAKRVRRILRSIMHKSFDSVYTISLIPVRDLE